MNEFLDPRQLGSSIEEAGLGDGAEARKNAAGNSHFLPVWPVNTFRVPTFKAQPEHSFRSPDQEGAWRLELNPDLQRADSSNQAVVN